MQHERRNRIVEKVILNGTVRIADLAAEYGVSVETIRRDLKYLEEQGYLNCVYGGAISRKAFGGEPEYEYRKILNLAEKRAIASCAASLVPDRSTIYLDVGTTVLEAAKCLYSRKNLTVITNAMKAAQAVLLEGSSQVIFLGGFLRDGEMSVSGFPAEENLSHFHMDLAILGAGGVTADGITDYHIEEAHLRRMAVERADKVIVLADYSKFGVTAMNQICPFSKISVLITDQKAPKDILDEIRKAGTEVIVAKMSDQP